MPKKLLSFLLIAVVVASIASPVFAEDTTTSSEPNVGTTSTEPKMTLEERQAARKERLTTALSDIDTKKIANRCEAAQKIITGASERVNKVYDNRRSLYDQLTAKLVSLSARVANQGVDTSALDVSIQETQAMIDTFFTDFDNHKQTMTDSSEVACKDDPEGFKLALEDARAQRVALRTQAAAIKEQITTKVKPELQNIRAILVASKAQAADSADTGASDTTDASDPDAPVTNTVESGN